MAARVVGRSGGGTRPRRPPPSPRGGGTSSRPGRVGGPLTGPRSGPGRGCQVHWRWDPGDRAGPPGPRSRGIRLRLNGRVPDVTASPPPSPAAGDGAGAARARRARSPAPAGSSCQPERLGSQPGPEGLGEIEGPDAAAGVGPLFPGLMGEASRRIVDGVGPGLGPSPWRRGRPGRPVLTASDLAPESAPLRRVVPGPLQEIPPCRLRRRCRRPGHRPAGRGGILPPRHAAEPAQPGGPGRHTPPGEHPAVEEAQPGPSMGISRLPKPRRRRSLSQADDRQRAGRSARPRH